MTSMFLISLALSLTALAGIIIHNNLSLSAYQRLSILSKNTRSEHDSQQNEINWAKSRSALESIRDRLGQAGFFTTEQRLKAKLILLTVFIGSGLLGYILSIQFGSLLASLICIILGLYFGAIGSLLYLKTNTNNFRREIYFHLPLSLETLILLVESGLGILPAIEKLVSVNEDTSKPNPVIRLLRLVYELSSHGMPFEQALEMVADASNLKILRHVLLHLDISGSEGGELVPSLRSLSDHTHIEWKLSVETRVKQLENFVVFPVFASVLGLMLLTSSVPAIPLLKFREAMQAGKTSVTIQQDSQLANEGLGGI
jgi:Flp pilus assembly protein TadB